MRKVARLLALAISVAAAGHAYADEVIFKNGDHLSGTIDSMDAGKMVVSKTVAGKVTVDMKDVKTFSTTGPIALKLKDGTTTDQPVAAAGAGQVALAPGGAIAAQNLPIDSIKYVNYSEAWTGHVTVAGSLARGNTDAETLNIDAGATRRSENDRLTLEAGYLYGRDRIIGAPGGPNETANDWFVGGKYDYFFKPQLYGYGNARAEKDVIAGIDLRLTPGVGVGYQFFDRPDFHLSAEGGVSYLFRSYDVGPDDESIALRLAYHVDKKIGPSVYLFHNVEFFPGLDELSDYYFTADAGIRTTLTEKMYSELKVLYRYDDRPAPDRGRNDLRFLIGVGWNF